MLKASGGLTNATATHGVDFWATGTFDEAKGKFVHGYNSACHAYGSTAV